MKTLAKIILFAALISMAWSWGSIFGRFKDIKEKKDTIKDSLNLEHLGLSSLKDLSLKDIAKLENLDLDTNMEKVKNLIPKKSDSTPHSDFDAFWSGMFNFFGLDKPTEIIECHGKISGNLFFRKLRKINDILQNSKSGNNVRLHSDYVQLKMIVSAIDRACKCAADTREYKRLGDKLDISSDPEAFMNAAYFYYEAKYHELAEPFEAIIKEIDSGNIEKAGKMFGQLLKKAVNDYKKTGEDLLAYQAFHNGLSSVLDIPPPTESVKCHDSRTAKLFTDFIKGASNAVSEGSWYKAEESFTEFWKKEGEELLNKLPAKVVKCERSSADTKAFTDKVGTDPFSDEFTELMFDYLSHHSVMYYGYMRSIKKSIDNGDYLHAGVTHGHLIQSATKK